MSLFTKVTNKPAKALLFSVLTVGLLGFAGLKFAGAQNISINGATDCDTNAVMYCGAQDVNHIIDKYKNGDGHNSASSMKQIYSQMGISEADIKSMNNNDTKVVVGYITKANVVIVDGKVIATDVTTGGRCPTGAGSNCSHGANSFYVRQPSQSFNSNSLPAYVVIRNGQFAFAIMSSCGNPIKATPVKPPAPTPKPAYEVEKKVKVKGSGDDYSKSVKVKPGTHVMYTVNVKSTGQDPVKDVNVKDNLPAHVKYVNGTLSQDGASVGPAQTDHFFSDGVTVDHIAPNNTVRFTFEAVVGADQNPDTCEDMTLTNTGRINAPQLPPADSSADVNENCTPPKPEFQCVNLQAVAASRLNYTFKAKSTSADGAKIKAYTFDFGDGKSVKVNNTTHNASATHSYPNLDQDKEYTVTVTVHATVNGKDKTDTSPACKVTVKVAAQPEAECTGLTLTVGENRSITAQATVATKNGAQLTSISYDFDDGTNMLVNDLNPVSHTYANDGDYLVKATVTFNINGQNSSSLCQAPVTFTPPTCEEQNGGQSCQTCEEQNGGQPCVTCEEANNGQPCVTCEEQNGVESCATCEMQNGGQVCATCEETVAEQGKGVCETPSTLVNTGPGETAAMFAAVTILGTLGYRTLLSRRLGQF